jgi:hypothetical protein
MAVLVSGFGFTWKVPVSPTPGLVEPIDRVPPLSCRPRALLLLSLVDLTIRGQRHEQCRFLVLYAQKKYFLSSFCQERRWPSGLRVDRGDQFGDEIRDFAW